MLNELALLVSVVWGKSVSVSTSGFFLYGNRMEFFILGTEHSQIKRSHLYKNDAAETGKGWGDILEQG